MASRITHHQREREVRRQTAELLALSSDELRERLRESHQNSFLWMPLVTALAQEGRESEALSKLGEIIEARGSRVCIARKLRAGLLTKLEQYEEAITDIKHLIDAGDEHPAHFYQLGQLYRRLGDVQSARTEWHHAMKKGLSYKKRPNSWRLQEWVAWFMFATLLNVRYYARFQILWSYLTSHSPAGSDQR
jgi:predicted Zn-dependent protease